jgi:predicted DNA binding CopG/RHH family protein
MNEFVEKLEKYSASNMLDRESIRAVESDKELHRAFDAIEYAEQRIFRLLSKDLEAIKETINLLKVS